MADLTTSKAYGHSEYVLVASLAALGSNRGIGKTMANFGPSLRVS